MYCVEAVACFNVEASDVVEALRDALLFKRVQELVLHGLDAAVEALICCEHSEVMR